jgi:hypothetical protein
MFLSLSLSQYFITAVAEFDYESTNIIVLALGTSFTLQWLYLLYPLSRSLEVPVGSGYYG